MHSLNFDATEEGRDRWDICYGGMLVNPEGYDKKTRRVARKILERLETIAKPIKDASGLVKFELRDIGGAVEFENVEIDLIRETVDSLRWVGAAIIKADKCVEWLETFKEK